MFTVLSKEDPVETYIIVGVLAGLVLPVIAIIIPFILNDPDGTKGVNSGALSVKEEGVETNDEVTSDLKVFVKSLKYCVLYPYIGKGFEEDTCGVKAFDEVYCNPRIQGLGLLSK